MSAFMCSEKHINTIVSYGIKNDATVYPTGQGGRSYWHPFQTDPNLIASILTTANVESVNLRYGKDDVSTKVRFKPVAISRLSAVQIIKLCDCFDYQASEVNNYDQPPAAKIIEAVRARAIDKLPGYAEAVWAI